MRRLDKRRGKDTLLHLMIFSKPDFFPVVYMLTEMEMTSISPLLAIKGDQSLDAWRKDLGT